MVITARLSVDRVSARPTNGQRGVLQSEIISPSACACKERGKGHPQPAADQDRLRAGGMASQSCSF